MHALSFLAQSLVSRRAANVLDPEEAEDAGVDDGDVWRASHAVSTSSHGVSNSSHVAASTFSHTRVHSNSTTSSGAHSQVDTEDDSLVPITPLPGARFDIKKSSASKGKGKGWGKKAVAVPSMHYLSHAARDGGAAGAAAKRDDVAAHGQWGWAADAYSVGARWRADAERWYAHRRWLSLCCFLVFDCLSLSRPV